MDRLPRNARYRRNSRAAHIRQRKQLVLVLAALALLVAILTAVVRQPTPQTTQSPTADALARTNQSPASRPASVGASDTEPAVGAAGAMDNPDLPGSVSDTSDVFFNPQRFSYAPDLYQPQIQAFLDAQPGPLKSVRFQVGDRSHSFAEVLVGLSNLYSLNPQILLALLEQQSQLLSTAQPSTDQTAWALGFQGDGGRRQGLFEQLRWGAIEMRHAVRDYAIQASGPLPELVFADDSRQAPPPDISMPRYALARVLARTTTPEHLPARLDSFLETYMRLFDDPRLPPADWPLVAEPFLTSPMEVPARVTSFFDHDTPFLQPNGSLVSFWGRRETALSYDGHTGWDYGMRPPDAVLAAADGIVVFAGNSEDGCSFPARAVILDHANGYRTFYWHLNTISVEIGQSVTRGSQVGVAGATGCAFGPHLHFQVQYLGRDVDPYGWCGTTPDPWANNPAGQLSVWLWADMPSPCAPPPPGVTVVDNTSPGFARSGDWQTSSLGYGGSALFTATTSGFDDSKPWQIHPLETPAVAIWRPDLPAAGRYRVMAYIPYVLNGLDDSKNLRYNVRYRDGEAEVTVDGEASANGWADLGTYDFDAGDSALVSITTLAGGDNRGVWADAVTWVPVQ